MKAKKGKDRGQKNTAHNQAISFVSNEQDRRKERKKERERKEGRKEGFIILQKTVCHLH